MSDRSDLEVLSQRLGHEFIRPALLEEAVRHSSYVNEVDKPGLADNERLEFLGDAVLDLAISHILMDLNQEAKEGDLSKFRASVVNERSLSQVAGALRLGDYLLLGRGEEITGGREKPSILANTLEALLGALYLDAGFSKTKEIIYTLFVAFLGKIDSGDMGEDFKSQLQEFTQMTFKTRPEYVLVDESGPAHEKVFRVALYLNGEVVGKGAGKSKKEAEQKAAKEALCCLRRDLENS